MRRPLACSLLLLLAGCQREPDFDERYEAARQAIREKSEAMERELRADEGAVRAAQAHAGR